MSPADARPSRESVLDAFAVESELSRSTLERYLRLYPEYAGELIDLSRELNREACDDTAPLSAADRVLVDAAWSQHEMLMSPSMHLNALVLSFSGHPDAVAIKYGLEQAFSLGHEFGIERAADVVDRCNREGPYSAIGAARRIRALQVVEVQKIATTGEDFL